MKKSPNLSKVTPEAEPQLLPSQLEKEIIAAKAALSYFDNMLQWCDANKAVVQSQRDYAESVLKQLQNSQSDEIPTQQEPNQAEA